MDNHVSRVNHASECQTCLTRVTAGLDHGLVDNHVSGVSHAFDPGQYCHGLTMVTEGTNMVSG